MLRRIAVPDIDPKEYKLIVKGKGVKKKKYTLDDLKRRFKKHEVITTLQCAGNRREDMHSDGQREFLAPHWVVGAISCAKWGGGTYIFAIACLSCINDFVLTGVDIANILSIFSVQSKFVTS